jgi:uncharacterized protein YjbI with pentapeptide repeats
MALDFSGQNLRGRSFKNRQDLVGANFSYADIRGANFAGANLQDANFCQVKAGLQERSALVLVGLSWLTAGLSGFLNTLFGYQIVFFITSSSNVISSQIAGWVSLVVVIVTFISLLWRGIAGALPGAIAAAFVISLAGNLSGNDAVATALAGYLIVGITTGIAGFVAGCSTVTGAGAVVIAVAVVGYLAGAIIVLVVASAGALAGGLALAGTLVILVCSGFIGWRAMKGDEKYAPIRNLAVTNAALYGTNFRNANLTNADFAAANLKSTDFRQATLIGTRFHKVSNLDLARPGDSYLKSKQLRQLIVGKDVADKIFDRQDLRGINLQGIHLAQASFIGADLSNANLQEADLSHATLVQAQVGGTDFTGAILTGAVIQDWNITTTTKFDGVECEEVFMREPTPDNLDPHRKPDNRKVSFAKGEFGDFIKPIFDTLDLYHTQGVDPRAFALSFKKVSEDHPDAELEIVAIEKRGQGFMVRVRTAPQANKSKLHEEHFDNYDRIITLSPEQVAVITSEKDERIEDLEQVINNFNQGINFNTTNIFMIDKHSFYVGGNAKNINNFQGDDNHRVDQSITPESNLNQEQILQQLADLIDLISSTDLPPDTKTEILEDLTAAKTATDKAKPNKPRALERLNSAANSIEKTSKTLEAGQKIWAVVKPLILPIRLWLGA